MIRVLQYIYLGILSIEDIKEKSVPFFPLLAGGALLVFSAVYTCLTGELPWRNLIGGLVPGAVLLLLAQLTKRIGTADGLVVMVLGAQYGLRGCLLLLFFSLLLLSVFSVILLGLHRADGNTRVPYLPFLTVGLMIYRMLFAA